MHEPLASLLRPKKLEEFVGQTHLVGPGKPLRICIENGDLHSMILWGPPGTGKTTLAKLIANICHAEFVGLSAVMAGVKDIRETIKRAKAIKEESQVPTILFIDEIHRFNKAQQDALLHDVEDGTVYFIGATTENPSFEVNNALLSRCRLYVLKVLSPDDLLQVLIRAAHFKNLQFSHEAAQRLTQAADGDARRLLNTIEIIAQRRFKNEITLEQINQVLQQDYRQFDKHGDVFYEQISALHKAVRGSSPDGALYWLCRMLDGGCDPVYIARRIVRMATEDIGNADPRGLTLAMNAWEAFERLGHPEGDLALAQAVVYLACAPKSNAVYTAFNAAKDDVEKLPSYGVPLHIRNAPTGLMKKIGYGKNYRYDPDEVGGFAKGQSYFPQEMGEKQYYFPTNNGLEIKISEKLEKLRDQGTK